MAVTQNTKQLAKEQLVRLADVDRLIYAKLEELNKNVKPITKEQADLEAELNMMLQIIEDERCRLYHILYN